MATEPVATVHRTIPERVDDIEASLDHVQGETLPTLCEWNTVLTETVTKLIERVVLLEQSVDALERAHLMPTTSENAPG